MIDTLSIISNGGVVLWQNSAHETGRRGMINRLIQDVLLEDRAGVREFNVDDYKLRWSLENEAKFFAVAVYPKFVVPHYMDHFLREVVSQFSKKYSRSLRSGVFDMTCDFSEEYRTLVAKFEASERGVSSNATGGEMPEDEGDAEEPNAAGDSEDDENAEFKEASAGTDDGEGNQPSVEAHRDGNVFVTKDGRRLTVRGKRGTTTGASTQHSQTSSTKTSTSKGKKPIKAPTTWETPVNDPSVARQMKGPTEEELQAQAEIQKATYIKRLPNGAVAPVKEREWEGQQRGRLADWLRGFVGSREVDQQDLDKVIPQLREKLIGKNVAVAVADDVSNSVMASLSGKKLGTFDSLYKTVEASMVASLRRILQPKHEVNILRDVASAKARNKPYSIVLCGVNGVGKSTSLAKIAYWLQQNDCSVLIAAGDTFRHGAVEQLEVHGRCLGVPVFQMGYGSDPSAVAAAAIAQASRQHTDVVMIDTAGRMQDHESRMRALAKLIHDNQPDLVLFVGEALVGNNGVDQLRKFNQCLVDYAPIGTKSRGIDGIVLTKFDTIDDKVGAALSMVYELSQPIVFVGVGQTYQDLKVIEPDVVVSALMK